LADALARPDFYAVFDDALRGPGVLMPSTPSAYPQVIRRHFASFLFVKSSVSAAHAFFAPGSIPGSSTQKMLVRAKSLGQLFFCVNISSTSVV
jgi:hypothetical protein